MRVGEAQGGAVAGTHDAAEQLLRVPLLRAARPLHPEPPELALQRSCRVRRRLVRIVAGLDDGQHGHAVDVASILEEAEELDHAPQPSDDESK